jgi:hypothetical protein
LDVRNNELAHIADGTYIYCQKSRTNTLQKQTYSVQKSRHLVKPFVICSTTDKIVDIYGLYPSTDNDSKIIQTILKSNIKLKTLLQKSDHLIVDRGFRDAIQTLQTKYKLKTYACLLGTQAKAVIYI